MIPKLRRLVLGFSLIFSTLPVITPTEASRVRQLNLEELTQRAAKVFSGRCTAVRVHHDPALDLDITIAEFEVSRAAKGHVGRHVVVRSLGGGPGATIPGRPEFTPGEEVVLFLYGESRRGLTSPVGLGQGKFKVLTDKQGRRIALNELGNRDLFNRPGHGEAASGSDRQQEERRHQPISPEALLDIVEALERGR